MINNKLIYDLGSHDGTDTKLYLSKGYNVIAVEANPEKIEYCKVIFKKEIENNQLTLVDKAIVDYYNINYEKECVSEIEFYITESKSEWSSCIESIAKGNNVQKFKIKKVYVDTVTLRWLFDRYGVPYYMKVDIEGLDSIVARNLFNVVKPKYVSFEISKVNYCEIFAWLYVSGYRKFQLINQINNSQNSSGLFGEFLDKDKWISYDSLLTRYIKYKELKYLDNTELAIGWLDVHATF